MEYPESYFPVNCPFPGRSTVDEAPDGQVVTRLPGHSQSDRAWRDILAEISPETEACGCRDWCCAPSFHVWNGRTLRSWVMLEAVQQKRPT